MKLSRNANPAERGGFTMIELMVVILIISILVALTAAAVMKALGMGSKTANRSDIAQLESAIEAFKAQYTVNYIPSRIILRRYYGDYFNAAGAPLSQLDQDSVTYLTQVFHKGGTAFRTNWSNRAIGMNWHSSWASLPAGQSAQESLEGEQCLVFFLGGIQAANPNGCLGFSTDDTNPAGFLTATRSSFFTFQSARLVVPGTQGMPGNGNQVYFFAYVDGYGAHPNGGALLPYVYFSNYGIDNGYNKYAALLVLSDCASQGVWPYAESNTPTMRYIKPSTFQIISAGADGVFGSGTDLTQAVANQYYWNTGSYGGIPQAGKDDQANFAANLLQAGP